MANGLKYQLFKRKQIGDKFYYENGHMLHTNVDVNKKQKTGCYTTIQDSSCKISLILGFINRERTSNKQNFVVFAFYCKCQ